MKKYMSAFLICFGLLLFTNCKSETKKKAESNKEYQSKNTSAKKISPLTNYVWTTLLQKHVSAQGKVDYQGFQKDREKLNRYLKDLANHVPSESAPKNKKLAYWINTYNAFTVQLILDNYPIKSIRKVHKPFKTKFFKLNGKKYSLDDVEHEILQKMDDPRIHFAINCASESCPKLKNTAYEASKIDAQLDQSVKDFLTDTTKNDLSKKDHIEISKIFKWYKADFEKVDGVIPFINKYSSTNINEEADINYKHYNWDLNEQ